MNTRFRHFDIDEFACPCCGANEISEDLVERLDEARDEAGVPFEVASGYRCEDHNRAVGGVEDSAHTLGLAADIEIKDPHMRYKALCALLEAFERVGIAKTFIHVDIDYTKPEEVVWVYK